MEAGVGVAEVGETRAVDQVARAGRGDGAVGAGEVGRQGLVQRERGEGPDERLVGPHDVEVVIQSHAPITSAIGGATRCVQQALRQRRPAGGRDRVDGVEVEHGHGRPRGGAADRREQATRGPAEFLSGRHDELRAPRETAGEEGVDRRLQRAQARRVRLVAVGQVAGGVGRPVDDRLELREDDAADAPVGREVEEHLVGIPEAVGGLAAQVGRGLIPGASFVLLEEVVDGPARGGEDEAVVGVHRVVDDAREPESVVAEVGVEGGVDEVVDSGLVGGIAGTVEGVARAGDEDAEEIDVGGGLAAGEALALEGGVVELGVPAGEEVGVGGDVEVGQGRGVDDACRDDPAQAADVAEFVELHPACVEAQVAVGIDAEALVASGELVVGDADARSVGGHAVHAVHGQGDRDVGVQRLREGDIERAAGGEGDGGGAHVAAGLDDGEVGPAVGDELAGGARALDEELREVGEASVASDPDGPVDVGVVEGVGAAEVGEVGPRRALEVRRVPQRINGREPDVIARGGFELAERKVASSERVKEQELAVDRRVVVRRVGVEGAQVRDRVVLVLAVLEARGVDEAAVVRARHGVGDDFVAVEVGGERAPDDGLNGVDLFLEAEPARVGAGALSVELDDGDVADAGQRDHRQRAEGEQEDRAAPRPLGTVLRRGGRCRVVLCVHGSPPKGREGTG